MRDIKFAKQTLLDGNYTAVFVKRDLVMTTKDRGVKPLLALVENGKKLRGYIYQFSQLFSCNFKISAFFLNSCSNLRIYVLFQFNNPFKSHLSD